MKRSLAFVLLGCLVLGATPAVAQAQDSLAAASDTSALKPAKKESRLYYGGSLGLSLSGRVFWMSVQPLVGYKLTTKASIGTRLTYQYVRDRRQLPTTTSLNFGGSVFTRYRIIPPAYALAEFEYISIDLGEERELVPFLLVGAGYVRPLGPKTAFIVEVLVDLIRDDRARQYRDVEPRINMGIGVGF